MFYAIFVYAFLYFPIVVLVIYSFNGSGVGGFPPTGWTLDWYRQRSEEPRLNSSHKTVSRMPSSA